MRRRQRWLGAMIGSGVVHGALLLGLVFSSASETAPPPEPDPTPITIRFVTPPPPAPEASPADRAPAEASVAPAPRARARAPAPRPRPRRPRAAPPPAAPEDRTSQPVTEAPAPAPAPGGDAAPSGSVRDPDATGEGRRSAGAGGGPPGELDLAVRPRGPPGPQLILPTPGRQEAPLKLRPRADGGYDIRDREFSARIAPDGTLSFRDKSAARRFHGTSFDIDITDEVMRAIGDDPYRHAKEQIRLRTRPLRARMAAAACEARLNRSVVELRGRLDQIWTDPALDLADRRALLFRLWDDCAEDGDPDTLRAAEMARATIYAFIQRHLPEGDEHAYRPEELEAFNRRRTSRVPFEPYARL